MDIFTEIKKLNFPADKYVVFGGASLAARGIRKTNDIDILVAPSLLEEYKSNENWKTHHRLDPNEPPGLESGIVQIYPTIGGGFKTDFQKLRANAEIINDIPFCNLEDVICIKQTHGRDKDLKDVELIRGYLDSKKIGRQGSSLT